MTDLPALILSIIVLLQWVMCGIFDSVRIFKEPDFVNITDDTEDTDTLNVSLLTSLANVDETIIMVFIQTKVQTIPASNGIFTE